MTNFDFQEKPDRTESDELFSIPVKAGKRIYYFDVKSTRNDDYYVTVTESRKRQSKDGSFTIDKHKIHLYKEDFDKFVDGLNQAIDFIREHKPQSELTDTISQSDSLEDELFKGL